MLEMVSEPFGQGEHSLPHRSPRKDMVDQMGDGLRHAAGVARGADAAALAGEGDEEVMAAVVAAGAGEPIGQDTALQKPLANASGP